MRLETFLTRIMRTVQDYAASNEIPENYELIEQVLVLNAAGAVDAFCAHLKYPDDILAVKKRALNKYKKALGL